MGNISSTTFTIDIDTGSTFTDGYIAGGGTGVQIKADSTPHDLTVGIMACLDRAAEVVGASRRELLSGASTVRLSTTVGTNALINRTGAKVGLLLSRDLFDQLAKTLPDEVPLEPDLIVAVPANDSTGQGSVSAVKRLLERGARVIVLGLAAEDVAAAESTLRSRIADEYPRHYLGAVPVLPSHQVSRTPDPAARVRTAVLNAYLHPLMSGFLYRVEDQLRAEGYRHPLLVGNADGGTSRVAKTTAIRTWGSGPAGGVAGAAHLAAIFHTSALVTMDIGGTSSDLALVDENGWRYVVDPSINGATVAVPVLELQSVGIGGGSVVRVKQGGVTVGPDSAGAQPGPAAFGLGGEDATLTDALCCAGVFDAANFLGGRKKLDLDAARRVFERVAAALGADVTAAVDLAVQGAAQTVANEILELLTRRGRRPADVDLLVGGGAGGLLGCLVAAAAGLRAVRFVPMASVFSAYGLSVLDRMHSYELTGDRAALPAQIDRALERARSDMRTEGIEPADLRFEVEIETGPDGAVSATNLGAVSNGQEAASLVKRIGEQLRLVRLRAIAATQAPAPPVIGEPTQSPDLAFTRWVNWGARQQETNIYPWATLRIGQLLTGPAVVEGEDTTFLIPPDFSATVGTFGDLLIPVAKQGA